MWLVLLIPALILLMIPSLILMFLGVPFWLSYIVFIIIAIVYAKSKQSKKENETNN
jgi:uncharacterized membrane protein